MECALCLEAVSAELDGELGDAESVAMREHLARCSTCRSKALGLNSQHRALRVRMAVAAPDLSEEILASAHLHSRRRWERVAAAMFAAVAAAGVVAVLVLDLGRVQNKELTELEILDVHASTGRKGGVAEAYFYVSNPGKEIALVRVTTPIAERAELHVTSELHNVLAMIELSSVGVPGGGAARLSPGGTHVMLVGLLADIKAGDQFPIRLHLDDNSTVVIDATAIDGLSAMAISN